MIGIAYPPAVVVPSAIARMLSAWCICSTAERSPSDMRKIAPSPYARIFPNAVLYSGWLTAAMYRVSAPRHIV